MIRIVKDQKVFENKSMLDRELVEIYKFRGNAGMGESINHKYTASNTVLCM